jgi:anti-anti-sigma regulatory factor
MLRIQRNDTSAHTVILILQGRIVADWADLLERECLELLRSERCVVLDLADVVFIGRSGLEALGRVVRAGARVIGCTPLFAAMLKEEGISQTVRTRKEKSS